MEFKNPKKQKYYKKGIRIKKFTVEMKILMIVKFIEVKKFKRHTLVSVEGEERIWI